MTDPLFHTTDARTGVQPGPETAAAPASTGGRGIFSAGAKTALILLWLSVLAAAAVVAGCASHHGGDRTGIHRNEPEESAIAGLIGFYRGPLNHLGAVREGSCPMHPSCSEYAAQAMEKHGPVAGWVMTMDRLIRCGRDETDRAEWVYFEGQRRFHDPVSSNDFWWHRDFRRYDFRSYDADTNTP